MSLVTRYYVSGYREGSLILIELPYRYPKTVLGANTAILNCLFGPP